MVISVGHPGAQARGAPGCRSRLPCRLWRCRMSAASGAGREAASVPGKSKSLVTAQDAGRSARLGNCPARAEEFEAAQRTRVPTPFYQRPWRSGRRSEWLRRDCPTASHESRPRGEILLGEERGPLVRPRRRSTEGLTESSVRSLCQRASANHSSMCVGNVASSQLRTMSTRELERVGPRLDDAGVIRAGAVKPASRTSWMLSVV